jgi:cytochrome oxidase Cu insertion factor (SCO1/SenC/PrrC family)
VTEPVPAAPQAARRRKARLQLLLIGAVCAAPIVLGTLAYYFFPPTGHTNYGELLPPRPLPAAALQRLDGEAVPLAALQGKWIMVQLDSGYCEAACERKLYHMRQTRLAQGKDMDRIERLWILLDEERPAIDAALTEGAIVAHAPHSLIAAFPAPRDVRDHIYLVDPLGNLMLRFPPRADPRKMIKDLQRLLRLSRVG